MKMKMLKMLMMIVMMSLHSKVNAGANCKSSGHVLKCERFDGTLIKQSAEDVIVIGYCPKVNFPKMETVSRLIISSTPMTCDDFAEQSFKTDILLNGKQCKKTVAAATESTRPSSTIAAVSTTSSTVLEAVIVTMNKTWVYVSLGLIAVISLTCVVCCVRLILKRQKRSEERTLNYHIGDLESVTEFELGPIKND